MTDRLMLLDSASLYFRAFYGVPDTVKAPDGTPVNAVRGFLDIITRLVTTYEPTHLIACWDDDWRPQWRVDLIPTYKTHRVAEVTATGPDVEVEGARQDSRELTQAMFASSYEGCKTARQRRDAVRLTAWRSCPPGRRTWCRQHRCWSWCRCGGSSTCSGA